MIDYKQVQARVNAKYDLWQRDILSRFGVKLGNAMKEMHASILKARNKLEHHSLRFDSLLQSVCSDSHHCTWSFITFSPLMVISPAVCSYVVDILSSSCISSL